jgi:hypothetical protein
MRSALQSAAISNEPSAITECPAAPLHEGVCPLQTDSNSLMGGAGFYVPALTRSGPCPVWYYFVMDSIELKRIRHWFDSYTGAFVESEEDTQINLFALKVSHTMRVVEHCVFLAAALDLTDEQSLLAQSIGWLHDLGRFEQYRTYRTFLDSVSVNHALRGLEVMAEHKVLDGLSDFDREVISDAVKYHNVFMPPEDEGGLRDKFIRLIRDADKLDIFDVMADYYEKPQAARAAAVGNDMPDGPGYSSEAVSNILDGRMVSLGSISNLNDNKLLNLSWVYDLNFAPSFRWLIDSGCLERIAATLPQTKEIKDVLNTINKYVKGKALSKM